MFVAIFVLCIIWGILVKLGCVSPPSFSSKKSYEEKDMEKYWWIYEQQNKK